MFIFRLAGNQLKISTCSASHQRTLSLRDGHRVQVLSESIGALHKSLSLLQNLDFRLTTHVTSRKLWCGRISWEWGCEGERLNNSWATHYLKIHEEICRQVISQQNQPQPKGQTTNWCAADAAFAGATLPPRCNTRPGWNSTVIDTLPSRHLLPVPFFSSLPLLFTSRDRTCSSTACRALLRSVFHLSILLWGLTHASWHKAPPLWALIRE